MAWAKGTSGNPAGRRKGFRAPRTRLYEALMDGEGEAIVRATIDAAKGGDMTAARLILEHLMPSRKGRPLRVDLPVITGLADIATAAGVVTVAVAKGDLTPDEGAAVNGVLAFQRDAIEAATLEDRIAALEALRD